MICYFRLVPRGRTREKNISVDNYNPFAKSLLKIESFDKLLPAESVDTLVIDPGTPKFAQNEESDDEQLITAISKLHVICII